MVKTKYIIFSFILAVLSLASLDVRAQSSRDSESDKKSEPSSIQFSQTQKSSKKSSRKSRKFNKPQALIEYEKLKKEVQKEHTKKEKGMRKPQYSDPSYFGHKKPPKKRKTGKKKFCKECGMTH